MPSFDNTLHPRSKPNPTVGRVVLPPPSAVMGRYADASKDLRKQEKRAARERERNAKKLTDEGARFIASNEQLVRDQWRMLARFAKFDVPQARWGHLERCRSGKCAKSPCSAACWFGDRGKVNGLILEAADILEDTGNPLHFVTILDPHYAVPVGELGSVSIAGLMGSLRRRFREAGHLFADDLAFGIVEAALEVLPDGRRIWFVHVHLVIASNATSEQLRDALRPPRDMPDPQGWGRKRWKSVVVKPVTDLVNLLAYNAKRIPEVNQMSLNAEGKRKRYRAPLLPEDYLEYDLWLLAQRPNDRVFKKCMKEVHGKLAVIRRSS